MHRRPLLVTIVGCVFIAAGAIGFFYHLGEVRTTGAFPAMVWVELVRLIAVLAGAFVLRGRNWARWLAIAWIEYFSHKIEMKTEKDEETKPQN